MDNNQNNYSNPYESPESNAYSSPYSRPENNTYTQPNAYAYTQPQSQPVAATVPAATRVLSIISMVTGIVGLALCWCYGYLIVCSIAALVTGSIARNKANGNVGAYASKLKAGKVTGIIGLILNIIFLIVFAAIIGASISSGYYY